MIELTPAQAEAHRRHIEEDQAVATDRSVKRPVNWNALDPQTRAIWAQVRRAAAALPKRREVRQ
jgi:hypothetical protein